jgi:hypothetical protein
VKRIDRKRLEALQKVLAMSQALAKDIEIASEQRVETIKTAKPTEAGKLDITYSGKTALRALFNHLDGLAYIMRFVAVEYAQELRVQIPDQEQLALQELRATKDGRPAQPRLSPLEHLKLALQTFPALFGIELALDLSTEHAKAFLALVEVRNEMARPETLEQLSGKDIQSLWIPGSSWYLAQVNRLLSLCAQQIPDSELTFPESELPDYQHTERRTAGSTGDDKAVKSLRTPEHIKKAFELLVGDTSRSMGVSTKMAGKDDLQATYGQFGLRNLMRTVLSEVDTTIAIAAFVLSASPERSDLAMTDQDVENLRGRGDLDQKLLEVTNLWSAELGEQKEKTKGGKKWELFRQALKVRDRLTYPKAPKELRVILDEASVILGAQDWLREHTVLLTIDPEKWPKAAPEPGE